MRTNPKSRIALAVMAVAAITLDSSRAATSEWLTGKDLLSQLQQPVPVLHWRDAPLRQAVETLAGANRVAMLIDRRVDPGQPLTLSVENVPLTDVFRQAADRARLSAIWIGPVLYYGPPQHGPRLETALELRRDEIRRLPGPARGPWLETGSLQWDDFTEPRQLLRDLAQQSRLELAGLEQLPHDLWAAADLPPIALVDRLGLIAGQYDLTLQVTASARMATLVPIPRDVAVVRTYAGGRVPADVVERWKEVAPTSQFEIAGGKIVVRGLLADHHRISELMHSRRPQTTSTGTSPQRRYTIREAKGTRGRLLEELAGKLQLDLQRDDLALQAAGISLDRQVSLSVFDATLEELLEALLQPAGCVFHLKGKTLVVGPASKPD